jgi:hypothetical protein
MIDHKPWKRKSKNGIGGQHIAIVGYSHYGDPTKDSSGFTTWAMKEFISGSQIGGRFFPPIQSYFGYEAQPDFWNRVHFFNFIPVCFPSEKKFATANKKLVKHAQTRFLRILHEERPDKVFVFTRKGWNQCPSTLEEDDGRRCRPLKSNHEDNWGTYEIDGHKVRVCGFKHPLYSNPAKMKRSVQEFLAM